MASLAAPISNKVKKIWDDWNLRSFIILSLSLQTFLILFAPLRKRTSSKWLIVPIWLAYLLADWSANFAIGLIASSQTNTDQGSPENGNLLAFWAPFLLLHLGGPDTIIAIAMEDNALWPRHLLGLIFQVVAAMYVFGMQFSNQNKLLWPTLFLFVPGLVKYGERTRALYLASLESLKETILAVPEPGPDYAKYMDEYSSRKAAHLPIKIEIKEGRSSDSKNVTYRLGEGDVVIDNITLVEGAHHFTTKKNCNGHGAMPWQKPLLPSQKSIGDGSATAMLPTPLVASPMLFATAIPRCKTISDGKRLLSQEFCDGKMPSQIPMATPPTATEVFCRCQKSFATAKMPSQKYFL